MANELMLPPYLYPSKAELELADTVGQFNPAFGYAVSQRVDYGATRWRAKLTFEKLRTSERHALLAFVNKVGRLRSFMVPVYGEAQRGSGVFTELLTNNTFANGTTGWTGNYAALSAQDRVMRATVSAVTPYPSIFVGGISLTQYAPYVLRSVIHDGRGTAGASIGPAWENVGSTYSTSRGLLTFSSVSLTTEAGFYPAVVTDTSGYQAGDFIECPWTSLSRCALVDNGPNRLLQSDDFTTTWANARTTDAANSTAAPDGTTTADSIIEDATASNTHHMEQGVTVASAAADYAFSVGLKAGTRSFARIDVTEGVSGHSVNVYVNLSTGALGTPAVDGANWTNPRAFVVNQGNGWYRVTIVGRKASAATTITPRVFLATDITTHVYTGDGASMIYAWRASLAQSSVPVRGVQTTTAAVAATAQTGSALHTKGWLPSTDGLLLAGDLVNIAAPTEQLLVRLTAALNTDAAGLGYLQFEPSLPESPVDNAPVIPNFPLLKCAVAEVPVVKTYPPGFISDVELQVEGVFG